MEVVELGLTVGSVDPVERLTAAGWPEVEVDMDKRVRRCIGYSHQDSDEVVEPWDDFEDEEIQVPDVGEKE